MNHRLKIFLLVVLITNGTCLAQLWSTGRPVQ